MERLVPGSEVFLNFVSFTLLPFVEDAIVVLVAEVTSYVFIPSAPWQRNRGTPALWWRNRSTPVHRSTSLINGFKYLMFKRKTEMVQFSKLNFI